MNKSRLVRIEKKLPKKDVVIRVHVCWCGRPGGECVCPDRPEPIPGEEEEIIRVGWGDPTDKEPNDD